MLTSSSSNSTKPMGFWGMVLEPNLLYSQEVPISFKITMASLGPDSYIVEEEEEKSSKTNSNWNTTSTLKTIPVSKTTTTRSMVMLTHEGQTELSLCSLVPCSVDQQSLDIAFSVGEEIKLRVIGDKSVHLTGYFIDDLSGDDDYCGGYDSEELEAERDGESIASTSSDYDSEEEEEEFDSEEEEEEFDSEEEEFDSEDEEDSDFITSEEEEMCHGHSSNDDSFIVEDDVEEYITSSSSSSSCSDSELSCSEDGEHHHHHHDHSSSCSSSGSEELDTEEEEELFKELNKRYSKNPSLKRSIVLSESDSQEDSDLSSESDSQEDSDLSSESDSQEESLCDSGIEFDNLSDVSFESADYDNLLLENDLTSSSEDDYTSSSEEDSQEDSEEDSDDESSDSEDDSDIEFNTSEDEAFAAELYHRVKKLQKRNRIESSSSSEEEEEEEEILSDEAFAEGETQESIMKKEEKEEVAPIVIPIIEKTTTVPIAEKTEEPITPVATPMSSPKKNTSNALVFEVLEASSKKAGIKSQKGRQVTLEGGANAIEVQAVLESDSLFSKSLLGMGIGEKRKIHLSPECLSSPCPILKQFNDGESKDITITLTGCQNVNKNITVSLNKKAKKDE